jgi:hypothetical protein
MNGKEINYEAVKAALLKNQEVDGAWDDVIANGIEVCKTNLSAEDDKILIESFESCLIKEFIENCVSFDEHPLCYELQAYRKTCPTTKFKFGLENLYLN